MTKILKFGIRRGGLVVLSALVVLCSSQSFAQTGTLRGGQMVLSNGSNTVTLKMSAAAPSTWTFTLPKQLAGGTEYLYDDGTGTLLWSIPISSASANNLLYNVPSSQPIGLGNYDFFVGYTIGNAGPDVGGYINVIGNGTGETETGFTIDAENNKGGSSLHADILALDDTVYNAGTGTVIGLNVTMSGNAANNSALIVKAGEGLVGINTLTPTQELEVDGDILISGGTSGLKINEWSGTAATAGTMGTATLGVGGTVVVASSSITATSRIFVSVKTVAGVAVPGNIYVSLIGAGTFTITSTLGGDRSVISWWAVGP